MSLEEKIDTLTQAVAALTLAMTTPAASPANAEAVAPAPRAASRAQTRKKEAAVVVKAPVQESPDEEDEAAEASAPTYDDVLKAFLKLYETDKEVNGDEAPITRGVLTALGIKGRDGGPPKIAYLEEDRYAEGMEAIANAMAKFARTKPKDVSFV